MSPYLLTSAPFTWLPGLSWLRYISTKVKLVYFFNCTVEADRACLFNVVRGCDGVYEIYRCTSALRNVIP